MLLLRWWCCLIWSLTTIGRSFSFRCISRFCLVGSFRLRCCVWCLRIMCFCFRCLVIVLVLIWLIFCKVWLLMIRFGCICLRGIWGCSRVWCSGKSACKRVSKVILIKFVLVCGDGIIIKIILVFFCWVKCICLDDELFDFCFRAFVSFRAWNNRSSRIRMRVVVFGGM